MVPTFCRMGPCAQLPLRHSKRAIEERMAQGADVILKLTTRAQIKNIFANAVSIFILPPVGKSCVHGWSAAVKSARHH